MTTGIRWLSLAPGSGLGNASAAYLTGLREAGVPVSWSPLTWPSRSWGAEFGPGISPAELDLQDMEHRDIIDLAIPHDTVVVLSTPMWNARLVTETQRRRLVAYSTGETDRLAGPLVDRLNRYDRVLVPSRFNREVFQDSGVTVPVLTVPHCATTPPVTSSPQRMERTFVFYLIATWTTRKAILDTVAAFVQAFDDRDPVALVIHTTAEDLIARYRIEQGRQPATRFGGSSWFALAQALAGHSHLPEIRLSTRRRNAQEMAALHLAGDCCVSLSRGEGWGLGTFEAGTLGRPVVVTGWGGHLEYLPDGYPYCADYELVPTMNEPPDAWWNPQPGESWAKVNVDHAAQLLRAVFEQRDVALEWGIRLQDHICSQFSTRRVTQYLLEALESAP